MKRGFFAYDTYKTKEDTPRLLLDRLMFNTRFVFISKYFSIVLKNRRQAIKGKYDDANWVFSSIEVFTLIEKCGGRFHLTGLDNLNKLNEPVVFVSNHMSTLETMIFPCIIAPTMKVAFVVKESLINHALFGPIMRSRHPIAVQRTNPREDFRIVMEEGKEILAKGTSIVIFPQTTRSVEFKPEEFNTLGVKLAASANVKVVPVAIKTDFWGNGKYLKELGPIDRKKTIFMDFGEPFSIVGNGKSENNKIIEFISQNLSNWNSEPKEQIK